MAERFEPAMDAFGLEFEEIDEALGGNWGRTLWGCAFEDFLTRRVAPGDQSPVEAYLRRRGWKEPVAPRAYMTTLQVSVMSLYEVSGVVPGDGLRLSDLVRGGEPVTERSATRTLKDWDRVAARVIPQASGLVLAGGLLAFTPRGRNTCWPICKVGQRWGVCLQLRLSRPVQHAARRERERAPTARSAKKLDSRLVSLILSAFVLASNSSGKRRSGSARRAATWFRRGRSRRRT